MSQFPSSITHGSSLAVISEAISRASGATPLHYVERRGELYRWSPAHRGGPYPLLRTLAKVLGIDHHQLVLPFATVHELCIVPSDRPDVPPDAWTLLELKEPASPDVIATKLLAQLTDG